MRCHDFSPDDTPQTTLQAGDTFEPWSRTVWSIMKRTIVKTIKRAFKRDQNAEENNPPPHLFALGSVCLQLFCELEPFEGRF